MLQKFVLIFMYLQNALKLCYWLLLHCKILKNSCDGQHGYYLPNLLEIRQFLANDII